MRAARPQWRAKYGAGAGCSAIKYQSLQVDGRGSGAGWSGYLIPAGIEIEYLNYIIRYEVSRKYLTGSDRRVFAG